MEHKNRFAFQKKNANNLLGPGDLLDISITLDPAANSISEEMDRLLTARYVKSRSWQEDMMAMFFCAAQNAGEGGMTMACCSMDGQQDLQSTTTFFLDKPPPGGGANGRGLARSPVSFNTHESVKGVKLVPDTDRYYNRAISDVVSAKRKNENYVVPEDAPASKGDAWKGARPMTRAVNLDD